MSLRTYFSSCFFFSSFYFFLLLSSRPDLLSFPTRRSSDLEAGRQRPFAVTWLDSASAQQHLVIPDRQYTHDIAWVLVMDGPTIFTDSPQAIVVGWHAQSDRSAALTAEFLSARRRKIERRGGGRHGPILYLFGLAVHGAGIRVKPRQASRF